MNHGTNEDMRPKDLSLDPACWQCMRCMVAEGRVQEKEEKKETGESILQKPSSFSPQETISATAGTLPETVEPASWPVWSHALQLPLVH